MFQHEQSIHHSDSSILVDPHVCNITVREDVLKSHVLDTQQSELWLYVRGKKGRYI